MDKKVLWNLSYGVYVVSTLDNNRPTGCIANSIMQITYDTVAVSINHDNFTNECIKKSRKFAISILGEKCDDNVIPTFGFQTGRSVDKFAHINSEAIDGLEIIKNAVGYLICDVDDILETETHTVFLGKIKDGACLQNDTPMTYAYYHQIKNGKSPKNAPTYIEENVSTNEIAYKCSICGYIYNGDITQEPEEFLCPICKQPKSVFIKI